MLKYYVTVTIYDWYPVFIAYQKFVQQYLLLKQIDNRARELTQRP